MFNISSPTAGNKRGICVTSTPCAPNRVKKRSATTSVGPCSRLPKSFRKSPLTLTVTGPSGMPTSIISPSTKTPVLSLFDDQGTSILA